MTRGRGAEIGKGFDPTDLVRKFAKRLFWRCGSLGGTSGLKKFIQIQASRCLLG